MKVEKEMSVLPGIVLIAIKAALGVAVIVQFSACTIHAGVDWFGQTAKDNRNFTELAKGEDGEEPQFRIVRR